MEPPDEEVKIKEEPTNAKTFLTYTSEGNIQIEITVKKEEIIEQNYEKVDLLEDLTMSDDEVEIIENDGKEGKTHYQEDLEKTDEEEGNDLNATALEEVDDLIEEEIERVVDEWQTFVNDKGDDLYNNNVVGSTVDVKTEATAERCTVTDKGNVSKDEPSANSKEPNNVVESAGIIIDFEKERDEPDNIAASIDTVQDLVESGTSDPNFQMLQAITKKGIDERHEETCSEGREEKYINDIFNSILEEEILLSYLTMMEEEFIRFVKERENAQNIPGDQSFYGNISTSGKELNNNENNKGATVTTEVEKTDEDNQKGESDDVILIEPVAEISTQQNGTPNSESIADVMIDVKLESAKETFDVENKGLTSEGTLNPEVDKRSTMKHNENNNKNIKKSPGSKLNALIERLKKQKEEKRNATPKESVINEEVKNNESQEQLDINVTKELGDSEKDLEAKDSRLQNISPEELEIHKQRLLDDIVNENLFTAEHNDDKELHDEFSVDIKIEDLVEDLEKETQGDTSAVKQATQAEKQNYRVNDSPLDICYLDDFDDDSLNVFTENIINENTENYTDLQNLEDPLFNDVSDSEPQVDIELPVAFEYNREPKRIDSLQVENQIEDIGDNEIENTIQGLKHDEHKVLDDFINEEIKDCVKDFLDNELQDDCDNNNLSVELRMEELFRHINIENERKVDDGPEIQNQIESLNDLHNASKSNLDLIFDLASIDEIEDYLNDKQQHVNLEGVEFIDKAVADSTDPNITKQHATTEEELDQDKIQLRLEELKEMEIDDIICKELEYPGIIDSDFGSIINEDFGSYFVEDFEANKKKETQNTEINTNKTENTKKVNSESNEKKADRGLGVKISSIENILKQIIRISEDSNDGIEDELRNLIDEQLQSFAREVDNTSDEDVFDIDFEELGKGINKFTPEAPKKQQPEATLRPSPFGVELPGTQVGPTDASLLNSESEYLLKPESNENSEHKPHRRRSHRHKSTSSIEKRSKHHSRSDRKLTSKSESENQLQSDSKTDGKIKAKEDDYYKHNSQTKAKHEKRSDSNHKSKPKDKNTVIKNNNKSKEKLEHSKSKYKSQEGEEGQSDSNCKSKAKYKNSISKNKSESRENRDNSNSKHKSDCTGKHQKETHENHSYSKSRSEHDKLSDSEVQSRSKKHTKSKRKSESNEKAENSNTMDKHEKASKSKNELDSKHEQVSISVLKKTPESKNELESKDKHKNAGSKHKSKSACKNAEMSDSNHKSDEEDHTDSKLKSQPRDKGETHNNSKYKPKCENTEKKSDLQAQHDQDSVSKHHSDCKDNHEIDCNLKNKPKPKDQHNNFGSKQKYKSIEKHENQSNLEHESETNDKLENSDSNSQSYSANDNDKLETHSNSKLRSRSKDKHKQHGNSKCESESKDKTENTDSKGKNHKDSDSRYTLGSKKEHETQFNLKNTPECNDEHNLNDMHEHSGSKHKSKFKEKDKERFSLNHKSDSKVEREKISDSDHEIEHHKHTKSKHKCQSKNNHDNSVSNDNTDSKKLHEKLSEFKDKHVKEKDHKHEHCESKNKCKTSNNYEKLNVDSKEEDKKYFNSRKKSDSMDKPDNSTSQDKQKHTESKHKHSHPKEKDKNHSGKKHDTKISSKEPCDSKHKKDTHSKPNPDTKKNSEKYDTDHSNSKSKLDFKDKLEPGSKDRDVSNSKSSNDSKPISGSGYKSDSKSKNRFRSGSKSRPNTEEKAKERIDSKLEQTKSSDSHSNSDSKPNNDIKPSKSKQESKNKTNDSVNSEHVESTNINSTSDSKNKRKKRSDSEKQHKYRRHSEPQLKSLSQEESRSGSDSKIEIFCKKCAKKCRSEKSFSNHQKDVKSRAKMSRIRSPKAQPHITKAELQFQNQSKTKNIQTGRKRKSDSKIEQKSHSDSKRKRTSKESNAKKDRSQSRHKSKIMTDKRLRIKILANIPQNKMKKGKKLKVPSKINVLTKKQPKSPRKKYIKCKKPQQGSSQAIRKQRQPKIVRPSANNNKTKAQLKAELNKTQQKSTKPEEKVKPAPKPPRILKLLPPELDKFVFTPDYQKNKKIY